jgi:hypothetical protein
MSDGVRRVVLGTVAVLGTAVWVVSLRLAVPWGWTALAFGVSASVSWLALGAALVLATSGRPSVAAWADACLHTMAVGIAFLMTGVSAGSVFGFGRPRVAVVILAASVATSFAAMTHVFLADARRLGLRRSVALGLWFGVLVGTSGSLLSVWFLGVQASAR